MPEGCIYQLLRHMVHRHTPACEEGRCRKKFPKPVVETTYIDERGGYTHYRQRMPQDAYVMPHNHHLLILGKCHINVEVSCTV